MVFSLHKIILIHLLFFSGFVFAQEQDRYSFISRNYSSGNLSLCDTSSVASDSIYSKSNLISKPTDSYVPKWYEMITNVPGDCLRFVTQEGTIDNIPKYAGIAALTAGLIITDDKTYRESDKFYHRSSFNKNFSDIFTAVGDGRTQFGLAAIFAAYGFIGNDNRALRTGSQIVEAVLSSGAVVQLIKHLTGREDPLASTAPGGVWRFFPNQIQYAKHTSAYDAFPSGHLTTSFAAFMVIANNYPEIKWIRPVSYAISGMIAVGMVSRGIHWYSDYPLAIDFGFVFADIVTNPIVENIDMPVKKVSYKFTPFYDGISTGLSFSCTF